MNMIFIIISLIILAAGGVLARRKSDELHTMSLIATMAIGLAVSVLTYPYHRAGNPNALFAILESFHYGTSTIGMNVDPDIVSALNLTGPLAVIYPFLLYSLYILGPVFASIFLIGFSRSLMEMIRFGRYRRVHVFSELNERSAVIAASLYKMNPRELRVFCASDSASDSLKVKARKSHSVLTRKEDNEIPVNARTTYSFYEIYEDSTRNLNQATELIKKLSQESSDLSNVVVRVFAGHNELELIRDIDARMKKTKSPVHVRYIDENAALAIELCSTLLQQLPVGEPGKHFDILLAGCGSFGTEALRTLTWLLVLPDTTYTIHVLDKRAKDIASSLKAECPEFLNAPLDSYFSSSPEGKNYDIIFYPVQAESDLFPDILARLPKPDLSIIALNDDTLNHRIAKSLYRSCAAADGQLHAPVIAARIRSSEITEMIPADDGILCFGNIGYCCDYSHLVHPELEDAAKKCHLAYMGTSEWTPEDETEFYRYVNENSSFAQALASKARRQYILWSRPEGRTDAQWIDEVLEDPDRLRQLAESEHDRWNAYQRVNGWRRASLGQAEAIAKASGGKSVKDDRLLLHPAIVPYSELAETEEQMNALRRRYNPDAGSVNYIASDYMIVKAMLKTADKQ